MPRAHGEKPAGVGARAEEGPRAPVGRFFPITVRRLARVCAATPVAGGVLAAGLVSCAGLCVLSVSGCGPHEPKSGGLIDPNVLWGEVGTSPGQFSKPRCIASDGEALWVIDMTARVQCLDPKTGKCERVFSMPESAQGRPTGVSVATVRKNGRDVRRLYVADTHYHRVRVYNIDDGFAYGTAPIENEPPLLAQFGSYGEQPGQFIFPTDVAVKTSAAGEVERIYVSEYGGNDRISVFSPAYEFLFEFGNFGSGETAETVEFNRPQSVVVDGDVLVINDACNHRVGRFTPDGKLLGWIGSPEAAGTESGFNYPYGLAAIGDGTVLVAEWGGNRVTRLDARTGEIIGRYGQVGRGPGQVTTPWATEWVKGEAFVLDTGNNRVVGFLMPRRRGGGA